MEDLQVRSMSPFNTELRALLQHTTWNVADIAYALGFEYPSYFNNYFKRMTGKNPSAYRAEAV